MCGSYISIWTAPPIGGSRGCRQNLPRCSVTFKLRKLIPVGPARWPLGPLHVGRCVAPCAPVVCRAPGLHCFFLRAGGMLSKPTHSKPSYSYTAQTMATTTTNNNDTLHVSLPYIRHSVHMLPSSADDKTLGGVINALVVEEVNRVGHLGCVRVRMPVKLFNRARGGMKTTVDYTTPCIDETTMAWWQTATLEMDACIGSHAWSYWQDRERKYIPQPPKTHVSALYIGLL